MADASQLRAKIGYHTEKRVQTKINLIRNIFISDAPHKGPQPLCEICDTFGQKMAPGFIFYFNNP